MKFGDITVRDFIAVMVSIGVFILVGSKTPVPDQVWSAWLVILTFFFSQKPANGNTTSTTLSTTAPTSNIVDEAAKRG